MTAFVILNARAVRRAVPEEAVAEANARPLDGRASTATPAGEREPYAADGSRQ